jgi:hypothetical protein
MAETQPQLQPALLRLSAITSQYFTETDSAFAVSNDEKCAVIFSIHANCWQLIWSGFTLRFP